MKLLIVEDDQALNNSMVKLLKAKGYSSDSAFNGQEALDFIAVAQYDLVILDVMMPVMDGLTFLEILRQQDKELPVLMLTAKDTLDDKITGLDAGADDYLVKPFEFEELLARIRAILRRRSPDVATSRIPVGDLELDLASQQVFRGKEAIDLTAKEYQLFAYLAQNQDQVISKDQIREHVWDFDYEGESNIIEVLIKNLRRKLDTDRKNSLIKTKRGAGYVIPKKQD